MLRLTSLLALAAFAVHQLRYLVAFGGDTGRELSHQGHDYLASAAPFAAGLLLAAFMATLLLARSGAPAAGGSGLRRAGFCGLAILAVYLTQETVEGAMSPGHPTGLDAVLASAGWVALPLALLLGVMTFLVERLLERAEVVLARPRRPVAVRRRPPRARGALRAGHSRAPRVSPVALGSPQRPPPVPEPAI